MVSYILDDDVDDDDDKWRYRGRKIKMIDPTSSVIYVHKQINIKMLTPLVVN